MGFFSFIVLLAIAYLIWRVTDQLPDLIFRLSEIQRDVAEIRRRLAEQDSGPAAGAHSSSAAASSAVSTPPPAASAPPAPPPPGATGGGTGADQTGA